ncbi:MAG: hypothetical protein K9K76_10155 [Halanaerobiales bacterium]|nr:hypothetical protein [Halanaerobiales bacterium]
MIVKNCFLYRRRVITICDQITGKDLLLLLLYLPGKSKSVNEEIRGKTRITKMIFLFEKEFADQFDNIDKNSLPEFFPYDYGPFSKELLENIRFFKMINFIEEKSTDIKMEEAEVDEHINEINEDIGYGENVGIYEVPITNEVSYRLTKKGLDYVENKIIDKINEGQKEFLIEFKKKINSLSLNTILDYVYNKYPDQAKESKIKDRYLN